MNIWFDFGHIPQYNFYRSLILQLAKQKHHVYLTVLGRGKMPIIIQHEMHNVTNVQVDIVGCHRMKKWSALVEANFLRVIFLIQWAKGKSIDVAFSNIYQSAIVGWLLHFPSYSFGDDFRGIDTLLKKHFSTCSHYCVYEVPVEMVAPKGHSILRCLKEWAYLAPKVFTPNPVTLTKYDLRPKQYLFLREVSVGTINYADQAPQAILAVKDIIEQLKTASGQTLKILFSLEEKHRLAEYPEDWILLQEPVEDIHSLMYYAAGLVSSGDSMAREAALLGVPSYYLGTRHSMPANMAAAKVARLHNELTMPFAEWLGTLQGSPEELEKRQEELRKKINNDFIDINEYMMRLVEKHNCKS